MILQLATTTTISLTLGQATTIVLFFIGSLFTVFGTYYRITNKIKNLEYANRLIEDDVKIISSALERKIDKLEETSKQWYKVTDMKIEEVKVTLDLIVKQINELNLKLEVHLTKCMMNHKNQ